MHLPRAMDTDRTITPGPRATQSLPIILRLVLAASKRRPRDVRSVIARQTRERHRVLLCCSAHDSCCLRHRGRGRGVL